MNVTHGWYLNKLAAAKWYLLTLEWTMEHKRSRQTRLSVIYYTQSRYLMELIVLL